MTKKTLLLLSVLSVAGIQQIAAMQGGSPITFNNPTDAVLIINGGMSFSYVTNLRFNNVQSVAVKTGDGNVIKQFSQDELPTIQAINISKDADTGEYQVNTEQQTVTHTTVTIHNLPDDTEVLINGNVVRITPTQRIITINGVKNILVQTTDGDFIKLLTLEDLKDITTVTIAKDPDTGEHSVTTT